MTVALSLGIGKFQRRASIGTMHLVRSDSDQHHVQTEEYTQDHLDASPLLTRVCDRLHHHQILGKMDICSTRTIRGANCGTDHQMLRSRVIFSIRNIHNQKGAMKPVKLNTSKLINTSHAESMMQQMDNALAQSWEDNKNPCWTSFQQVVYDTTKHDKNIKTGSTQMTRCYVI